MGDVAEVGEVMSEETLLRGKFRPVLGALTPIEPKLLKSVKFKSPDIHCISKGCPKHHIIQ